jgi:hypothetical protein
VCAGVLGKLVGRGGVCATPGVLLTTWVWLRSALVWRGVHWCGVECTVVRFEGGRCAVSSSIARLVQCTPGVQKASAHTCGAESPCQAWPSLGRVTGILRHMRLTYINDGWAEQRRCVVFAHCPEDPSNKAGAVTLDAALCSFQRQHFLCWRTQRRRSTAQIDTTVAVTSCLHV